MLDLFLWDFVKQIAQCCFPKGTPQQWEIWQSWGSPCAAGNWHPLGCRSTKGYEESLTCIVASFKFSWSDSWDTGLQGFVRDPTSKPSSISEVPVLISYLFVRFLAKKHLKSAVDFTFGIHQSAQKHLHHCIMEWSFIAESQVILHHLTSLDFSPKRSLRWHVKHLEVADAAKIHPIHSAEQRYQLGGWVLLPPRRLLQDLHLNCKHWY